MIFIIRQPILLLSRQTSIRTTKLVIRNMSGTAQYTAAAGADASLAEKLSAVRGFLTKRKAVMLTTRAPNGALHSRCMAPAEITPDWKFRFIYDRDSYWDTEIENE